MPALRPNTMRVGLCEARVNMNIISPAFVVGVVRSTKTYAVAKFACIHIQTVSLPHEAVAIEPKGSQ